MKYPYCTIDKIKYQLYEDENSIIRFPDDGRKVDNLNTFIIDYYNGKRPFKEILDYYLNSGCSYSLVEGYFSHYGINNHTVTQGNASTMHFVLFIDEDNIVDSGNPNKDRKKVIDYWKNQDNIIESLEMFIMNSDIDITLEMIDYIENNK